MLVLLEALPRARPGQSSRQLIPKPPGAHRGRLTNLPRGAYRTIVHISLREKVLEIAVDTSTIMAVILNEPSKPELLERTRGAELLSAPTLPWEVGNSLTALFKRARIDLDQAKGALESFREIAVRLAEIDLATCVEMAKEQGIYAYDAYMIECARKYGAPLLSLDGPQRQVALKLGIEVLEA